MSDSDFSIFESDEENIKEYIVAIELWHHIIDNLKDFLNHFTLTAPTIVDEIDMFGKLPNKYPREASRMLMNTTFMFRAFLDHMNSLFSRKYGKNSKNLKDWEKIQSKEYDECFCYRFVYKLRNYMQHVGSPPLLWKTRHVQDINSIEIEAFLDKEELLSNYNEWGALLKRELREDTSDINAIELMRAWGDSFYRLLRGLVSIMESQAIESAFRVAKLREKFSEEGELRLYHWPGEHTQDKDTLIFREVSEKDANLIIKGYPFDVNKNLILEYRTRNLQDLIAKAKAGLIPGVLPA